MSDLVERGERYLFMTVTFYWDGVVEFITPTHAILEAGSIRFVKDIGENPTFEEKKWPNEHKTSKRVAVALSGTHVVGPL